MSRDMVATVAASALGLGTLWRPRLGRETTQIHLARQPLQFGRQLLGVLQLNSSQFESDEAATEMVTSLLESKSWPELPPEAFEEDL